MPAHYMQSLDSLPLINRIGPLISQPTQYTDTKDPCPVFDGKIWHIFGSGGSSQVEVWKILHATAQSLEGPWQEQPPAILEGVSGDHVAAPGVVYDEQEKIFHMFVQKDFAALGGTVEHLISKNGTLFRHADTALRSILNTGEAGIYDPQPTIIKGQKYLSYSGTPTAEQLPTFFLAKPDLYLAKSTTNSWDGPWERMGRILGHEEVPHHNQHDHPDYEWGLEGSQLLELPNGKILMNAVCFLPDGPRGTRQRIFFAVANKVTGPYKSLGVMLNPTPNGWESGENGHAAAFIDGNALHLFYQARGLNDSSNRWRYGIASYDLMKLQYLSDISTESKKLLNPLTLMRNWRDYVKIRITRRDLFKH